MRIGILSPIAWRTPPRHYGPWETIASLLTEELVKAGIDVTLFATADSQTKAKLDAVIPIGYEEDRAVDAKVAECLHIANCFEKAGRFDLIHNHYDFLPLTYSSLVSTPVLTTIHGFSSPKIVPVYRKYNQSTHYVSISNADRSPKLRYMRTIYHGINLSQFDFRNSSGEYLLFFGRIHPDKGAHEAIQIALASKRELVMAGIIQDENYFAEFVKPYLNGHRIHYIGSVESAKRSKILGGAAALLHPIHFNEPFGLSVVEAMACGTPTIAFSRGSMPELISPGINGFLVGTVDEAIEKVSQISTISRNQCRRIAESRFSVQRMAHEYIEVYNEIISSAGQVPQNGAW